MNDNPDRIAATNAAYATITSDRAMIESVQSVFASEQDVNPDMVERLVKMLICCAGGRWFDYLSLGRDPNIADGPHAEDRQQAFMIHTLFNPSIDWDELTRRVTEDD